MGIELYFKQKFIEDSKNAIEGGREQIYPKLDKGYLLIGLIAKYLKPIRLRRLCKACPLNRTAERRGKGENGKNEGRMF